MPRPAKAKPELTAAQKAEAEKKRRSDFVKAINARGNKAYKAIGLLRNLANAKKFIIKENDIRHVMGELNKAMDSVAAAFENALKGGSVVTKDNPIKIE